MFIKLHSLSLFLCFLIYHYCLGGAKLISRALKGRHPNLKELNLDSNEIRISGGLEILEGIKDKTNLTHLSMDANQFGDEGEEKLRNRMDAMGKGDILAEMEDNEEPDLDEDDPDVTDDEQDQGGSESTPTAAPKSTGSLFSGNAAAKNLFGEASSTTTLFGTPKTSSTSSIFGGAASSKPVDSSFSFGAKTDSPSIFGGKTAESSSSLFGAKTDSPSIFGGKTDSPSIFGGAASSGNNNAGLIWLFLVFLIKN